jgi:hypothetical protein
MKTNQINQQSPPLALMTTLHHKEDNSSQKISFRKSSVRGSIPKDGSVRWSSPRWKETFTINDKGGDIYHMQHRGMVQGEKWSQEEHRGMVPGGEMVTRRA